MEKLFIWCKPNNNLILLLIPNLLVVLSYTVCNTSIQAYTVFILNHLSVVKCLSIIKWNNNIIMKLGDTFSSFETFESVFMVYKDTNFVNYFTKDCKTLDSINAKFPNGRMSTALKELKYYYIKYCCIHGGK